MELDKIREMTEHARETILGINTHLAQHPELSGEEVESAKYLAGLLRQHGFDVQLPYAGLETAFRAELKTGPGPKIGFLAEYDALPGYGPEKKPAHACGHNWIAATTVGAGLVLAGMKDHFSGTVVVLGCPAEETVGHKVTLAQAGAFDDIDAAFQYHLGAGSTLDITALALYAPQVEFFGKASHAAASPESGINALDAATLTLNGIGLLRQQLRSDARIHAIIQNGGVAANIIPDYTKMLIYVRAATKSYHQEICQRVHNIIDGACLMTGATSKISVNEFPFDPVMNNPVMVERIAPYIREAGIDLLEPGKNSMGFGSTDVGNTSYCCPVLFASIGIAEGVAACHEEAFLEYIDNSQAQTLAIQSVESLVRMALDLYGDPQLVKDTRAAFEAGLKAV